MVGTRRLGAMLISLTVLLGAAQSAGEDAEDWSAMSLEAMWEEVDRRVEDQRYEAASRLTGAILERARSAGDLDSWTRALIREVQLRTALHGYATAVRFLGHEEWPDSQLHRSILELFQAHGLTTYLQAYSWEIAQRELVASGEEIELESWTRDQIMAAANQAFAAAWARRESWGGESLGELAEYIHQNAYPARIRGTLRDAVTYLWVELLANSSFWSPEHESGIYRLQLEALLGEGESLDDAILTDLGVHPLVKIAYLLDDLERWHRRSGRPEAAFEARLERLRRLEAMMTDSADRRRMRDDLEHRLDDLGRGFEWWSVGMAELARMIRSEDLAESLVEALAVARAGESAHPESIGGRRCRYVAESIERPSFRLAAMRVDGAARRSIQVHHQNVSRLYLRAYALDLESTVLEAEDYSPLPSHREVPAILAGRDPLVEWSIDLPKTRDYRTHRTFVTPPLKELGLYVVIASMREDFAEELNRLSSINLIVSDLVLLSRPTPSGFEVTARSGRSGRALGGVEVALYRADWRQGHRRVERGATAEDGRVRFDLPEDRRASFFLLARRGGDVVVTLDRLRVAPPPKRSEERAALVYTDRTVYRPEQTLHWKIVAYTGAASEGRFSTLPETPVTVRLRDANGEEVATSEVVTNGFGSVAGEFEIPGGRLLGGWYLDTSLGGGTSVRVEEYKRPTFEVSIEDPPSPLRLNRPASLRGSARFYFGLPVSAGEVTWRVTREPVFPPWYRWFSPQPAGALETVAAGATAVAPDGGFEIAFTPEADERLAEKGGMSFRFRVSAEVTDEGGETRAVSRVFRLGFVAVEAVIESDLGFHAAGAPVVLAALRSDLDGIPRAGEGSWRLVEVAQPAAALLPADQPRPPLAADFAAYQTPGDRLRPRWTQGLEPGQMIRFWQDGREVATGSLVHDAEGRAEVRLPVLRSGLYRLHYETLDPFGEPFETVEELIVGSGGSNPLAVPLLLHLERPSVAVGETARLLVQSALDAQELVLEVLSGGETLERRILSSDQGTQLVELRIAEDHRGGLSFRLSALRDHQWMSFTERLLVPWDDRRLAIELATFRDRLRPGQRESWRVVVRGSDEQALAEGTAELLAYMYDRSLDLFAPHDPPRPFSFFPRRRWTSPLFSSLGHGGESWTMARGWDRSTGYPTLRTDRLRFFDGYPIGGPGLRRMRPGGVQPARMMSAPGEERPESMAMVEEESGDAAAPPPKAQAEDTPSPEEPVELRTDFSETAFWRPQLLIDEAGAAVIEFTVPESVTEWNFWIHALTRDLRSGSLDQRVRTVKELMVRPYLPRFLREGDRATVRVVVNNAGETDLSGSLDLDILDPETEASLLPEFGVEAGQATGLPFEVAAGEGSTLEFDLVTPARIGAIAFRVTARAGDLSDGEQRPVALLPGRMHLVQSRFAALRDADRRTLAFPDLAAADDPSRIDEQLVVTLDGQLFYGVLRALPYLVSYPYSCTEQTLNRFLSTAILTSIFDEFPAVAAMAEKLASRRTRLEPWAADDPNRRMALEETPWLSIARGGSESEDELIAVLDPEIAGAQRDAAIAELEKAQTSLGAFPWWPGGPPSPHMTLYILQGLSRAMEFGVEVPQRMVVSAWSYLHRHYLDQLARGALEEDCCWELVTYLNFVLSSYPDASWTGEVFTDDDRRAMLDFSLEHWKRHSPRLKGYLALTLHRAGRNEEARHVFASVMDSARSDPDLGVFWQPEERAWLWYNDTIESHATALRTLAEIAPDDPRRHGLVQWLLLHRKLNHWKSTRATAEVVYALSHYLAREGMLAVEERATVALGDASRTYTFSPDSLAPTVSGAGIEGATGGPNGVETGRGRPNQWWVDGPEIDPATMSTIVVEKQTPGLMFASATWHFSTEKLPEEAEGDLFSVTRRYFRRVHDGRQWTLEPLVEGAVLEPGDQLEVQLSLRARHAAEYVHLRDPRPAGFEPETLASGYRWDLGLGRYEEIRDSGTNFFIDWLPAGEYTLKHRLRASMGGVFRAAPAVLQSMYAPEFTAYSSGRLISVGRAGESDG